MKIIDIVESTVLEAAPNLGTATEAIVGVGIFFRLSDRRETPLTASEIEKYFINVDKQIPAIKATNKKIGKVSKSIKNADGTADTVTLNVEFELGSWELALNNKPETKNVYDKVAQYINNKNIARYNKYFSRNGKTDDIHIDLVGTAGNKTDIKTTANGVPLNQLVLSVKYSGKGEEVVAGPQINSRDDFIVLCSLFGITPEEANKIMDDCGWHDKPVVTVRGSAKEVNKKYQNKIKPVVRDMLYDLNSLLSTKLDAMTTEGEVKFVEHLLDCVSFGYTSGEKLKVLSIRSQGDYSHVNPKVLKYLASSVDLTSSVKISGSDLATIYIHPKGSPHTKYWFKIRAVYIKKEGRSLYRVESGNVMELASKYSISNNKQEKSEIASEIKAEVKKDKKIQKSKKR